MRRPLVPAAILALAPAAFAAESANYTNTVHVFSNGGGNASSTSYTLDACIGQPAVGQASSAGYGSESWYAPVFFPTDWHIDLVEGYNLIALPQFPDGAYNAQRLLQEINDQGGNATRVLQYNGSTYTFYTTEGGGTNFTLRPGEGYFVRCTVDSRWKTKGFPFARSTATIDIAEGYNLVALNLSPNVAYTASSVLSEINSQSGNATRILQYNPTTSTYTFFTSEGGGTNFTLRLGEGYFVRTTTDSTWTLSRD